MDRTSLGFRDEYALSTRTFLFGQFDYLRDTFKLIDYLVAPTADRKDDVALVTAVSAKF